MCGCGRWLPSAPARPICERTCSRAQGLCPVSCVQSSSSPSRGPSRGPFLIWTGCRGSLCVGAVCSTRSDAVSLLTGHRLRVAGMNFPEHSQHVDLIHVSV